MIYLFLLLSIRFRKAQMDVILALDFSSSAYLLVNSISPNCLVWSPDLLEIQRQKWLKYQFPPKKALVFNLKCVLSVHTQTKNLPEKNFCSPLGGGLHLNHTWQDHKSDLLLTIKVYDTYPPWSATNISTSSLWNNSFLGEKMSVLGMLSSSPRYLRW